MTPRRSVRSSRRRCQAPDVSPYTKRCSYTVYRFIEFDPTDFGAGRAKVSSKSADDYLKVHSVGPAEADVTEGSGGVWERVGKGVLAEAFGNSVKAIEARNKGAPAGAPAR